MSDPKFSPKHLCGTHAGICMVVVEIRSQGTNLLEQYFSCFKTAWNCHFFCAAMRTVSDTTRKLLDRRLRLQSKYFVQYIAVRCTCSRPDGLHLIHSVHLDFYTDPGAITVARSPLKDLLDANLRLTHFQSNSIASYSNLFRKIIASKPESNQKAVGVAPNLCVIICSRGGFGRPEVQNTILRAQTSTTLSLSCHNLGKLS